MIEGAGYQIVPIPANRQFVMAAGRQAHGRHISYGLLELDVTVPRRLMRQHKEKTGETLSFTAYIVACLARAVDQHKAVHAYRNWRNQLIVFDDVDVVTMIEAEKDRVAIPHVIRAANRRSLREIHDEIRLIQSQPRRSPQKSRFMALAAHMPGLAHDIFYRIIRASPFWFKRSMGTCVVTSVGMFGRGGGWGLSPMPTHTLGLTVGGIAEKPGLVDGKIEAREFLHLTLCVDHDVVDGAPAARFAQTLADLIESGHALQEA